MLRNWLVIPLAFSALCLLAGLKIDGRERLDRKAGKNQILETLEFWVKHRQDKQGLTESLEILRAEGGFSALGLCFQGRKMASVGDLRGGCGKASKSSLIQFWQNDLASASPYSVVAEYRNFSSLAGLLYFAAFLSMSTFVFLSFVLLRIRPSGGLRAEEADVYPPAPRPRPIEVCVHNENQLEI